MPKTPPEPKRQTSLDTLEPYVAERVRKVLWAMGARGYDAVVFEARRTPERQAYLFGIGRTHHKIRRPVTWTLNSRHIPGKAVDIISRSRAWGWPQFFRALVQEGRKAGLHSLAPREYAHLEYR